MVSSTDPQPWLVVVGRRSEAVRAALRRSNRVLVVAPSLARALRGDRRLEHLAAPPAATPPEALEDAVGERLAGAPVAAVLAATEAAVLPAARLRAALGAPGIDVDTARACTDKVAMKRRVGAAGVAHAPFVCGGPDARRRRLAQELGLPLVLKSRVGSGGRGTVVARTVAEIPDPLPGDRLAEGFLRGTELSVESLVVAGRLVWSNLTEYVEPRGVNQLPYLPPAPLAESVRRLARRAVAALGVERGLCHAELFVTDAGVRFGELAVRPPGGHIMELITLAYGFSPWDAWVAVELGEEPSVPAAAGRHAAVRVIHPGAGEVLEAAGLEAAAATEGIERAVLRVQPGDVVGERVGAGQEIGHLIACGADRERALARLDAAWRRLRIRVAAPGN